MIDHLKLIFFFLILEIIYNNNKIATTGQNTENPVHIDIQHTDLTSSVQNTPMPPMAVDPPAVRTE